MKKIGTLILQTLISHDEVTVLRKLLKLFAVKQCRTLSQHNILSIIHHQLHYFFDILKFCNLTLACLLFIDEGFFLKSTMPYYALPDQSAKKGKTTEIIGMPEDEDGLVSHMSLTWESSIDCCN